MCDHVLKGDLTDQAAAHVWLISADLAFQLGQNDEGHHRVEVAAKLMDKRSPDELQFLLALRRGDDARRVGHRADAVRFYADAQRRSVSQKWDLRRRTAMTGASSRSVEDALRGGRLDEAEVTLRQWARQSPECKLDGYFALLAAQYELARHRPQRAVLEAEDLLRIDSENPYADRLLLVVAQAKAQLGDQEGWKQTLEKLIRNYPGSQSVPQVRKLLAQGFPKPKPEAKPSPKSSQKSSRQQSRPPSSRRSRGRRPSPGGKR